MNIKSISASSIKTYEVCPHKFYTEYVLKKRPEPHPACCLGSALHYQFEKSCKAVILKEAVEKQNPFYWREEAIQIHNVLPTYHNTLDELTNKCLDWGYMTTLDNAKGFELSAQFNLPCGVEVHGYIDRLDIDPNWNANIIDLKTQKDMFNQMDLEDNWQAVIYYLATLKDNPMIQNDVTVSFWVLRHQIQTVKIAQNKFDELFQRLNTKTEEILKADGQECIPSGLCRFCCAECIHKVSNIRNFGKQDISQSAKETRELLAKIRSSKVE